MKKTKELYVCNECDVVSHHKIERRRVDSAYKYHYTPPYPQHEDAKHGYETVRICPSCGEEKVIKFESDCKLGKCGVMGIQYAGTSGLKGHCPHCRNIFSY